MQIKLIYRYFFLYLYFLIDHYQTNGGKDAINCTDKTVLAKGQLCKLNMNELFPLNSTCTGSHSYGYLKATPCVLLKINKVSSGLKKDQNARKF